MADSATHDVPAYNAAYQVLATAELLEMVLTNLSMRDLLLAQSVCSTWAKCIQSSS